MNKFNHEELLKTYKYCVKRSNCSTMAEHEYVFTKDHATYLEVFIYDEEREWRYILDNFPRQRKSFGSNIPVTSIKDFESDLKRMQIDIPEKV